MTHLTKYTLALAAFLVTGLLACDDSPTSPEPDPEPQRSVIQRVRVLDDGSARYLQDFKAVNPGASCQPRVIKAIPACAGGGALVEYECAVAVES